MAKKASRKLYHLIKSLSGTEKRYFKVYIRHWSAKNSKYLALFEAIEAQNSFDDVEIQEKIYGAEQKQSRKFSELKAFLYTHILNALQLYDEKKTVHLQLKNYLLNIAVLYKRSLLDAIPEQIQKAKKLALEHEEFGFLLELNDWEFKLIEAEYNNTFTFKKAAGIIAENTVYNKKYNNVITYRSLFFKIYVILKQDVLARAEPMRLRLEEVINHPLMSTIEKAETVTSKLLFHRISGMYFYGKRKWQDYYENNKKIIELIESSFFQHDTSEYISNLSNYCQSSIILKKYEKARQILEAIYNLPVETEDDKWKIHRQYFLNNFGIIITLGEFEKGLDWLVMHDEKKQQFDPAYFHVDIFYYNYFYIYFGAGRLDNALSVLYQWKNVPADVARPDLQSLVRVLSLILHYELNSHLYFNNLNRNARRFLKGKNRFDGFEKLFLKYLKKAYKAFGNGEKKAILKKLKNELEKRKSEQTVSIMLDTFDFMAWLESKITGKKFGDIIRGV